MEKKVLSVLVENHTGVLARVASLFCQRGFNIDSLTVSATNNPAISRITIVAMGDEQSFEQIIKQTGKLVECKKIIELDPNDSLRRELLLVKIAVDDSIIGVLREKAAVYRAKVIDLSVGSMVMELTGDTTKIDGFLEVLKQYDIIEMCRTGVTAMTRGS